MLRQRKTESRWGNRVRVVAAVCASVAGLATSASLAGDVNYTYDVHGRLVTRTSISPAGDNVTVSSTYDNAGNRTSVVTSTVDPIAPTVPTGLSGTAISATQINLSWNASTDGGGSGFAGYKVHRNGTVIGSTASTSYSDTTVVGSTTYQYTVSAYDNQPNESAQSSPINVSTPDITPPSTPSGLTGYSVNQNWVNLSWTGSTDTGGSGLAGYEILRAGSVIGTSATTSYSDQTVAASTQYTYTVRAYDGATNRSASSSPFTITTPNAPDTTPPSVPTGLGASAPNSTTVNLSWAASSDPGPGATGVAGYQIYRGGGYLGTTNATSLADTTVSCGGSYTYQVRAFDGVPNYSALTGAVGVTTPDTIAPSTPSGLSASSPASNQVNLSWSAASDVCSGVQGYYIYRGGAYLASTTATSFADTTTVANQSYSYQVQAYDAAPAHNTSGLSSAAGVTTPDTIPPGAPGSPTFSAITGSTATANWSAASDNIGVTEYRYSINSGGSWVSAGTALSASLTGLTRSTTYTMYLQARDAAGNWGSMSANSFTTAAYYTDTVSLTAGSSGSGYGDNYYYGYAASWLGSMSPTTLSGGKTVSAYYFNYSYYFDGAQWQVQTWQTVLVVAGFSSSPGQGWLSSITGAGTGASASSFYCVTQTSTCGWIWPSQVSPNGTITIVHQ